MIGWSSQGWGSVSTRLTEPHPWDYNLSSQVSSQGWGSIILVLTEATSNFRESIPDNFPGNQPWDDRMIILENGPIILVILGPWDDHPSVWLLAWKLARNSSKTWWNAMIQLAESLHLWHILNLFAMWLYISTWLRLYIIIIIIIGINIDIIRNNHQYRFNIF